MRKPIIFIFLIMSFVLVLVGCGGEPANETPEQVEQAEVEDEVVEEEPVEVEEDEGFSNPFANISDMKDYYYEVETKISEDGTLDETFNSTFWASGNKSRIESIYPNSGEHIIMIMDGDENISYMYMVNEDLMMIMDYTSEQASLTPEEGEMDYIQAMKDIADNEDVKIEKGTFEGEPVQIITGDIMGNENKIWISTKTGFPLKSEYYEEEDLSSVSLFKNFSNKPVDKSVFEKPEAGQVMDMRQQP